MADAMIPDSKVCTKCGVSKPLDAFVRSKKGLLGRYSRCKSCHAAQKAEARLANLEEHRARGREKYHANPEAARQATARWRAQNIEVSREKYRLYREKNLEALRQRDRDRIAANRELHREKQRLWRLANPEKSRQYTKKWADANPEKTRQAEAKRRATPRGRLINAIRSGVHRGLTAGIKAGRTTFALLGYSKDDLVAHLEEQFLPGMSWDNYGAWHVDHKIPLSVFNFEDPEDVDFKRAWALENLQPLWAKENHEKKDKLDRPFQPSLLIR